MLIYSTIHLFISHRVIEVLLCARGRRYGSWSLQGNTETKQINTQIIRISTMEDEEGLSPGSYSG
jgi:hypothetical protein